jgi:hypothetical protein
VSIALYLALRFVALAWTLCIAGKPLVEPVERSTRPVAAVW